MGRITLRVYGFRAGVNPYHGGMDDLAFAVAMAQTAATIIRHWSLQSGDTEFKSTVDPVTAADRAAEAAMVAMIEADRPQDGLLGEEGSSRSGARTWVLDPIDGTVNFLHGIPHVAVSVGLVDEEGPLIGVILDVFKDELFTARRGDGAHMNGTPISVSSTGDLVSCLVATGFPYDRQERAEEYGRSVAAALATCQGVRRAGSAALDLAWVATGRLDAYWEFRIEAWDMAAGVVLVREAGGIVTDVRGAEVTALGPSSILATNGHVATPMQTMIQPVLPSGS